MLAMGPIKKVPLWQIREGHSGFLNSRILKNRNWKVGDDKLTIDQFHTSTTSLCI